MGLFDLFKKPDPVRDAAGLETFVGQQTAFLVQKTTWEYSRIRSGVMWQKLFKEEGFKTAIEASTWRNFPMAMSFIGEMTVTTLRTTAGLPAQIAVPGVAEVCRRVIATQPQPRDFEATFWPEATTFVSERINRTLVAPPKAVKDIPLDGHKIFFERMPMHPELIRHDGPLLLNTLRIQLCRCHEVLLDRIDATALHGELERLAASDAA